MVFYSGYASSKGHSFLKLWFYYKLTSAIGITIQTVGPLDRVWQIFYRIRKHRRKYRCIKKYKTETEKSSGHMEKD
jgi:hypothetical protein